VMDMDRGESSGRGPVREVYSRNWQENQAVWHIVCAWTDRQAIALGMLGNSVSGVYTLPVAYYANPGWVCKKIECTGIGVASPDPVNGFIAFPYCLLTITFGVPQYAIGSTTMVGELSIETGSETIALDQTQSAFKFASDGSLVPPSVKPCMLNTTLYASLTLYNRGTLNLATLFSSVDCVNNATFQGINAGKVLFKGARSERTFTSDGKLQYNLTLMFEANPRGWNYTYRSGASPGWVAYTDRAGNDLYQAIDFTPLLA